MMGVLIGRDAGVAEAVLEWSGHNPYATTVSTLIQKI